MLFLEQIEFECDILDLFVRIIALDSGIYPSSQCAYGQCKFSPDCATQGSPCMGNLNWLTKNLPPTTAPYNPRGGSEYGVCVNE